MRPVADRFAVPGAKRVVDEVLAAVAEWPRHAEDAGVPDDIARNVGTDIDLWSTPLR